MHRDHLQCGHQQLRTWRSLGNGPLIVGRNGGETNLVAENHGFRMKIIYDGFSTSAGYHIEKRIWSVKKDAHLRWETSELQLQPLTDDASLLKHSLMI